MDKDINCLNFRGLLDYLRKHHGDDGVRRVINGLVDNERYLVADKENPSNIVPIQEHHLTDSAYWVSNEFSLSLFVNAKNVIGGSNPLFKAGESAVTEHFSKKSLLFISRVAGIKYIANRSAKLNSRFNRTKEVKLAELTDKSAAFEFHYHPNFRATKDICNWNLGIYTGLAKMTGAIDVKCEEVKCVVDGDKHCTFLLTWRKEPNFIKRMLKWILRTTAKDLIADYEITVKERDQLIDNLMQSEERYRALTDQSLTGIFIHHDGTLVYVNDCLARMLDYSPEDMIGKKFWDFVSPEDRNMVKEREVARSSGDDVSTNYKFRAIKNNGELLWFGILATTINYNGQSACMGNVLDLTSKIQADEALRESERKHRTVLTTVPDPVVVYDKEGKVIYFNPAFTNTFGWTLDERLGKKMDFFVPEENWPETRMMINKLKAGEDFSGIESRRFTKDGNIIDVNITAAVYRNSKGNPAGSVVNLRDITEKKIIQAETMRIGHLASLGELAAGVAHEINNPISGVIGYAEILQDRLYEQGQDDDIPRKIIKEGDRIAEIVKNLLSFAREREEERSPANIKDIILETLGLVERHIIKDSIEFSVDTPHILPKVKARSKEIQQVFLNIISNARYALNQKFPKFNKDKFLEIKSEAIEIEGKTHIRTTFYDGGIGIPGQIFDRISDPFFSTKPKDIGTGLGLSISHGIIQNHGGRLWFESVEGEYTKVMVDLPAFRFQNKGKQNHKL